MLSGSMENITYHTDGKQGFTGFTMLIIACLCHDCDWNCMMCTMNMWVLKFHQLYKRIH